MKKFLVMILLSITAVCFVLTEKKQNKVPNRDEAISWKMEVEEKDQIPDFLMTVDSVIGKKDLNLSPAPVKIKILNKDIQEMVDLIVELNGIQNPKLIQPGQLILCRFPDNRHFEFYEEVLPGQSLWIIVEHLLEVTSVYRPIYYSHSNSKK